MFNEISNVSGNGRTESRKISQCCLFACSGQRRNPDSTRLAAVDLKWINQNLSRRISLPISDWNPIICVRQLRRLVNQGGSMAWWLRSPAPLQIVWLIAEVMRHRSFNETADERLRLHTAVASVSATPVLQDRRSLYFFQVQFGLGNRISV